MGVGDNVGKVVFCICGPKGSLCCTILSVWGVIMLFLLGGFYYIEAVVLLEDFITSVTANGTATLMQTTAYTSEQITEAYHKAAYSCWGAGMIYVFFLALSGTFLGVNIWRAKVKAR